MKNVRLYHYKEGGREGGVEPGWDIIVLECDCSVLAVVAGTGAGCLASLLIRSTNSQVSSHFIR